MFVTLGSLVYRRRWMVITLVLAATVVSGTWGLGVFGKLSAGGYDDPASQSTQVANLVQQDFGKPAGDVVVVYTAPPGRTVTAAATAALTTLHTLPRDAVSSVTSYWDTHAPAMITPDQRHALAVINLNAGTANQQKTAYLAIRDKLGVTGLSTQIGGAVPTQVAMTDRSAADLSVAEAVSLPVTLILLVIIFGSVVAAALPVLVGGLAILGSLGVLRLIALGVDVNSFAPNVVSLLGLGLAIDYGLFTVGRFREEMGSGRTPAEAVRRTMLTSGRTVLFSATLLVLALAGLLVFPLGFLRSMAYGGMSAVAIAALVSVTLLPALLGVLGHRVDKLSVPWRRKDRPATDSAWLAKLANTVMRRPLRFAVPIVLVLAALAIPFGSIQFGAADERQLPPGDPTRQVAETITRYFPANSDSAAQLVLRGPVGQTQLAQFITRADQVPGVSAVHTLGSRDGITLLSAQLAGDPLGAQAKQAVTDLRSLPAPGNSTVLVGGFAAQVADSVHGVTSRLPWMIAILVAATLVLMFLAFGSVLLPIKAVLMSTLSLGATFGVLVAIFQQGHGAGLLDVTPQPVQAGMLVLIGAVVFGLSTDYETFLLSRMVEAHNQGEDSVSAVRTGLVRTGRMISSAALLLIVVTGAFALSGLQTMRFLGLGMIVALLLDATVVRLLLVPAVLRLLGRAAWWAPGPLRRLQQRVGVHEESSPPERKLAGV